MIGFLVLEFCSLYLLFRYNSFHEAAFLRVSTEWTGWFTARYDRIQYYFHLKETNAYLSRENERLLNQLRNNYAIRDTLARRIENRVSEDSNATYRQYLWRSAKVVGNTVSLPNNYLTLARGEQQGIRKDMGVIGANGIVGTVVNTSANYAVVMSLLHRQFRVSAKIKKSGDLGIVQWGGESPLYVTMTNVPKSVVLVKGDTVVTSQYSYLFPPGIMIGTVLDIVNDRSSNFYTLHLKTSTDFFRLEYVDVVENLQKEEQQQLEKSTPGKNE